MILESLEDQSHDASDLNNRVMGAQLYYVGNLPECSDNQSGSNQRTLKSNAPYNCNARNLHGAYS